jgi:hypothetical protein
MKSLWSSPLSYPFTTLVHEVLVIVYFIVSIHNSSSWSPRDRHLYRIHSQLYFMKSSWSSPLSYSFTTLVHEVLAIVSSIVSIHNSSSWSSRDSILHLIFSHLRGSWNSRDHIVSNLTNIRSTHSLQNHKIWSLCLLILFDPPPSQLKIILKTKLVLAIVLFYLKII